MSCAGATGRQIDDHIDLLRYPLRYPHARLRWTGHVHRRVGGVKGVRLSESCRRHRQPFQRHDSGVSNVARPAPRETAGASGQCSTSAHRSRFSHAALARSSFSSLHFALCLSGPLQSSYSSKYPGQYAVAVHDDLHVHVHVRISSMVLLVAYAFYYRNVFSPTIYHHMPRERRCLRHPGPQQ